MKIKLKSNYLDSLFSEIDFFLEEEGRNLTDYKKPYPHLSSGMKY